jgi:hypothetical protein
VLHPRAAEERPDTTPYPGCALPVGMKAQFWRSYVAINLHTRIETRSVVDCVLRELELAEAQLVALRAVAQQYVTFVESRSMDLGQVATMYHRFKETLADGRSY